MIFLTSAILKSLSLFFFNKIIMNQEIWIFFAMIRKNNRFFHKEIIKNYISMIIEKLVNAFDKFVKKIKKIDMTIFDINVYWNIMSNTSIASNSTFKSFILISNFAIFRSFKNFDVDIRMRSQNVERFKLIAQQILEKLNFKKFRVESSSDRLMKNLKKRWIWWFRKCDCLFEMICSSWLLNIVTIIYNVQETIINWGGDVWHEMNSALLMLFLLFLYWTNVLFRSFIYISTFIIFRP